MVVWNRSTALFFVGCILLIFGLTAVIAPVAQPLTWYGVVVKILELLGGGFLILFGVWNFAWSISDEMGGKFDDFLKNIWNKLFKHWKGQKS